jgi:hypothetical protein
VQMVFKIITTDRILVCLSVLFPDLFAPTSQFTDVVWCFELRVCLFNRFNCVAKSSKKLTAAQLVEKFRPF